MRIFLSLTFYFYNYGFLWLEKQYRPSLEREARKDILSLVSEIQCGQVSSSQTDTFIGLDML